MLEIEKLKTDVLVIGGGIAGLYAGVEALSKGQKVSILIKGPSCSMGILGFNVALRNSSFGDSPARFFDDLILGGRYLNDMTLIAVMAYESESILNDLAERFNIEFERNDRNYAVRRAAGSNKPRTVYHGDSIGPDIVARFLKFLDENGSVLLKGTRCLSLLVNDKKVIGAAALSPEGKLLHIRAKATVLATGGAGSIYEFCTTPETIDGDGYLMGFEAGADLMDMEFVQFEPFIFVNPPQLKSFSIPTTSIWDGAKLYNTDRLEFLPKDADGNVANLTKDVLSRLIHGQVTSGKGTPAGGVYMDWTVLPHEIVSKYPRFIRQCRSKGLDPCETPMEVAPACHHMMGGIIIDKECQTSVPGLFAAGEVTSGIHGSNRIAGAAGTDVLVFGHRAGIFSAQFAAGTSEPSDSDFNRAIQVFRGKLEPMLSPIRVEENFQDVWDQIRKIMWDKVGIKRNKKDLSEALESLTAIEHKVKEIKVASGRNSLRNYFRVRSASFVSRIIAQAALMREESRGDHFRDDFPERDDLNWLRHIVIAQDSNGRMDLRYKNPGSSNSPMWNM